MPEKFQNKYRIPSARAQWWDYGWNGAYFITICTTKRAHYFGEIVNGKMNLSPAGVIADILWHEIPNHSPFVELGDFVVMPNHVHGILILNKPDRGTGVGDRDRQNQDGDERDAIYHDVIDRDVETGHALSLQQQPTQQRTPQQTENATDESSQPLPDEQTIAQTRFQNIGKNTVSSIIGSYKSAVTKHANRLALPHGWQTRFHDRIIRDDAEYQRISDYIVSNPDNWDQDQFYSPK